MTTPFVLPSASESLATKLTGDLPAAIAVIEIQGPLVDPWLSENWTPANGSQQLSLNTIRYGNLASSPIANSQQASESVVVCKTASQRAEIHCHGGSLAASCILDSLKQKGFIVQSTSQWLSKHITDETRAQATHALLQAKTLKTTRILLDQFNGALSNAFQRIDSLIEQCKWSEAKRELQALQRWESLGSHLTSPFTVLLCGPPNVGKSSLLNRLLGYQRAIVHEQAGTTRDLLAEESSIGGWPVRLLDSAGVRQTQDGIEQAGIERAIEASREADLILLLVDPAQGWTHEHERLAASLQTNISKCKIVQTKCDTLSEKTQTPSIRSAESIESSIKHTVSDELARDTINVSAKTGEGIEELMNRIQTWLVPDEPGAGQGVPFHPSHSERIAKLNASCPLNETTGINS
jgi:tRNA modification GTPase